MPRIDADAATLARPGLWTPANVVTCARVLLVPLWLAMAQAARATFAVAAGTRLCRALAWASLALYVVIALTDKLDGWLARSRGEVTTFGKFLDPIADKLAVIAPLLFLVEAGIVAGWVVFVIVARELLVDGLRMLASARGVVVPAGSLGKWKTAVTMVAICVLLLTFAMPIGGLATVGALSSASLEALGTALLYVGVVLTVWSGVDYFVKLWPTIREGG